jgi:phosphatidylserine/phosphatidylglycerophosphate/cardiolipin synthase-like enzyme
MQAARHSIHHQYFIWRSDVFTEQLKEIMTTKARAGVHVRLLYGPIGSTPDRSYSEDINYEINAVLYDHRLAGQLEQDFEKDFAHCTPFDVGEYERRGPAVRFRDSVARLFSPLL